MSTNYKKIAQEVIEKVGGKDNIRSAAHCATRLRLIVKNREIINDEEIEKIPMVKGVFFNSGQYQIIFGTGTVNKVYEEIAELGISAVSKQDQKDEIEKNSNKIQKIIRIFGDVFVPIIPAMVATGLFLGLKGALLNDAFLQLFGLTTTTFPESFLTFITVLTDTTFAFLPALVCWSAFRTFGGSPILGILLGLMLVSSALPNAYLVADPNSGVNPIVAFGFIPMVGYQGSIIPAFIAGIVGAKIEKKLHNIIPNAFDLLLTPFLTLLIMLCASLFVIGPIFHTVEQGLEFIIQALLNLPFGIGGLVLGFITIFIVVTGVHHIINLIEISLIAATGFNPINPIMTMVNFACGAACLAITIKARKKNIKALGYSACISSWFGIGEPAIFGVNLRYGIKPMITGAVASAITGMLCVIFGLRGTANGVTCIPGVLLYIYDNHQLLLYVLLSILTIVLSFTFTWFFAVPKEVMEE